MANNEIETHKGSSGKPGKMVKTRALAFAKPRSLQEIQARQDAKGTRRRPTECEEPDQEQEPIAK